MRALGQLELDALHIAIIAIVIVIEHKQTNVINVIMHPLIYKIENFMVHWYVYITLFEQAE